MSQLQLRLKVNTKIGQLDTWTLKKSSRRAIRWISIIQNTCFHYCQPVRSHENPDVTKPLSNRFHRAPHVIYKSTIFRSFSITIIIIMIINVCTTSLTFKNELHAIYICRYRDFDVPSGTSHDNSRDSGFSEMMIHIFSTIFVYFLMCLKAIDIFLNEKKGQFRNNQIIMTITNFILKHEKKWKTK